MGTLCDVELCFEEAHVALVALYLRGAPRPFTPNRRLWPQVVSAIRESGVPGHIPSALRAKGLGREACLVEEPSLWRWAASAASSSLSVVSHGYPARWRDVLGPAAPPVVWARGAMSSGGGRLVGVVGSREVGPRVARFAHEAAREAVRLGFGVVSGGAEGCDAAAAEGAAQVGGLIVTVLPCGFSCRPDAGFGLEISVCAPDEPFSTAAAMERNALIYAASGATVVAQARFRAGGTWHGATDALRRRLTRLLVRVDATSVAHRALIGLGGVPLSNPSGLGDAVAAAAPQSALFALG